MKNISNPMFLKIVQKDGCTIYGAKLRSDLPTIPGYLPIESQDILYATQYISLDNIASFTVLNEESPNWKKFFYAKGEKASI